METTENEKREIVLIRNTKIERGDCALCENYCTCDGLDFFLKGTDELVYADCVNKESPDLAATHDGAHDWRREREEESLNQGRHAGKRELRDKLASFLSIEHAKQIIAYCNALMAQDDNEHPFSH